MTRLGAFILMYHRVAESPSDPWQLCVSPAHFGEQLEVLRRVAPVVPLHELAADLDSGRDVRGRVAVTFDDGYADNLLVARPLLARHGLPATIFIATGYAHRGREFWWDELDRVLLQPGDLPATLHVTIGGAVLAIELGEAAHYDEATAREHRRWRAYLDTPPTPRHAAYLHLWERLVAVPDPVRLDALDALAAMTTGGRAPRPSHRTMSHDDIATLGRDPQVVLGAHTVTHPSLPDLPLMVQRDEIVQSRTDLTGLTAAPVAGFAYPHGRYTPATVALVREAGFQYACAVRPPDRPCDLSAGRPEPYLLPRVTVLDWDGDAFERMWRHGFQD